MRAPNFSALWSRLDALTIRHILVIITAGLTLMIALLAGRDLYANVQRLGRAYELRDAIVVSDLLFDATGKVSVERDLALAMLQSNDPETITSLAPALAESRHLADTALNKASAALDETLLAQLNQRRRTLTASLERIRLMRPQLDAAFAVSRRARDPTLARKWEEEATDLMTDAEQLWAQFIRPYTSIEPVVTQHLVYRHALRTIADYIGRERSIIGDLLAENAAPTPRQTAGLLNAEGVLDANWRLSRMMAEQSGLYAAIAPQYSDAESHYATLAGMTREMFYVPGARGAVTYPIAPDLWFELSSQASESLGVLHAASRRATRSYLDGMIGETERAIAVQGALSLVAVLLCAASFWLIVARVVRPINAIVLALTRATRGEPAEFIVSKRRRDEIGQLTGVLEAFQRNVDEMRRTSAELDASARALEGEVRVRRDAEENVRAQLERLNLLRQIGRAIGERQDLGAIFDVATANLEARMPTDFACVVLRDDATGQLKVARVGVASTDIARAAQMTYGAQIAIEVNGLTRCMRGYLVYESAFEDSSFPFLRRLASAGLKALVASPLQVESHVFGALIVARRQVDSFSSAECEFLRQLSEHVALAAHQAQLYTALQQAYDDLRQTQAAAMQQERLRALGQMASGIAHDINNALSPVALYTESLLHTEPGLSDSGRQKLEIVQRAIEDAANTIARMNDFYRKRDKELSLSPVDPNLLVQQVLDLTQARWRDMPQQRGEQIQIRTELGGRLPAVLGVESEFREALTNLVFNAIDSLPPNSNGMITLRTKRTAPSSTHDGGVAIEVEDNGVGMDEATRQKCLEPFFTTKGERGTGLGLAMVYGMVQRHAGDLEIESTLGEGTIVRLIFTPAPEIGAAPQTNDDARPLARLRLLVIDDDPILLRSLSDVLEADGHVVTAAGDGNTGIIALTAALTEGKPYDALITDLGMPGMDGRRVAAAAKHLSATTPVILLTGWGERLRAEEETPQHIDCILSKPPKLREVRAALARYCAAEAPANAARA